MLRHRKKLLDYTKISENELIELENYIMHQITFINEYLLPEELIQHTKNLLLDIDLFDVSFIALATHLNAKLWTGDKKLYIPLREKGYENIILTSDLIKILFD